MERRDILPGVNKTNTPPAVVFHSLQAIRAARLRAMLIDGAQLVLMAGVDYLFVRFPLTHIPFADRHRSVQLLVAANVLMILYIALARTLPRWKARRIAKTWAVEEKARFRNRS